MARAPAAAGLDGRRRIAGRYRRTSLYVRVVVINAAIVVGATVVLVLTPATVGYPISLTEAIVLVATSSRRSARRCSCCIPGRPAHRGRGREVHRTERAKRELDTAGTASSRSSTARRGRSAAPERSSTPCATWAWSFAQACTRECEWLDGKVGGIAVHIGARVAAEAGPGEVIVSRTVKDLVAGSGIEFDERGSAQLKGVPGQWQLYAVSTSG